MDQTDVSEVMEKVREGEMTPKEAIAALQDQYDGLKKTDRREMVVAIRNWPVPEGSDAFSWLRKKDQIANHLIDNAPNEQKGA